jgi:hypothetical protein
MWLPMFIKNYNYAQMQKMGLRLTADQLYSINNSSLKDAIVQLGDGFCTGEMVSKDGLMFTNHHCGYSSVVELSSVEHDYLNNGFFAMSKEERRMLPLGGSRERHYEPAFKSRRLSHCSRVTRERQAK